MGLTPFLPFPKETSLIFGHFCTLKLSGWENMFHFLTSDVLKKKRGQTRESKEKKGKKGEKKQVLNKSGSLNLMQIVPQDYWICVYHTHTAHSDDYCQQQCERGLHFLKSTLGAGQIWATVNHFVWSSCSFWQQLFPVQKTKKHHHLHEWESSFLSRQNQFSFWHKWINLLFNFKKGLIN